MRQGHLPMVIQLMRYGADPSIADGEGYRALHLAILFQHMAIAAYLMAKGQVRLHNDFTSVEVFFSWFRLILLVFFYHDLQSSHLPVICLQEVDGPDCNGQTPLMLAAQKIIGLVNT